MLPSFKDSGKEGRTMKRKLHILLLTLTITTLTTLTTIYIPQVHAATLTLTINCKAQYDLGEQVIINGTLTQDGTPVTDALVTAQINKPNSTEPWIIRTSPTGNTSTVHWSLEITNLTTADSGGNPKTTFNRGEYLGFKVTIKNHDLTPHDAKVYINAFYGNEIPFGIQKIWEGTVQAQEQKTITVWPVFEIPDNAPTGTAFATANLLTDTPTNGGFAYCPEKTSTFQIESGGGTQPPTPTTQEGTYNITFRIPDMYAKLGNYTVHVISYYPPLLAQNTTTFEVILVGDLTGPDGEPDGKVNMRDIALVARAFGSYPGDENWNPIADLYPDGKINMRDIAIVARNYGKEAIP